jgi:alkaline phosphatase D
MAIFQPKLPKNKSERRTFLQLASFAAASAASLTLPRSVWSQTDSQRRFEINPFSLGVASGSPTHDSVVLWTRLIDAGFLKQNFDHKPIVVRWEEADDDKFHRIVQSGQYLATPDLAHSVHVEVQNLQPDRWYFYRFTAGDVVSSVGKTRTFPKAGAAADKLRIAYASCQRWETGYFSAYKHMQAEKLDAVLFLGDYIYEYPGQIGSVRYPKANSNVGFVISLDDYRSRYAQYKSEQDLQDMHAACPWLMTWDDHEVQNDYANLQAGYSTMADIFSNPENFAQRRAAAYQAYYEHMPIRASSLTQSLAGLAMGAEMRIYNRVDFGKLATFYMLDCRQYRDAQVCNAPGAAVSGQVKLEDCPTWLDPQRTLLGERQELWLRSEFDKAKQGAGVWNVLGQPSLFGQRDNKIGEGQTFWNDGWDGYSAARTRMTNALQKSAVKNAVFLGGDVHENWVGHVKSDYAQTAAAKASASIGVEFCGTSITSPSSSGTARTVARLAENPHFVFADAAYRGYGVVEFTPKQLTTTLRGIDDVKQKTTKVATLAQFVVPAGRAVIERA